MYLQPHKEPTSQVHFSVLNNKIPFENIKV
jgi:hypothetical protein